MKRATTAFTLALFLTGCAFYSSIEPRRTPIGDLFTVEPQIPWSKASRGNVEMWTVDGPRLQAVRFVKGLEDGEVLFEGKDKEKRPKFRKQMTPNEIMEFVVDTMTLLGPERVAGRNVRLGMQQGVDRVALIGAQKVEATNLRPGKFGDVQGFRFEMSFLSKEGLEQRGFVIGSVVEERLYLIMYTGVKAYYYAKHKDHVEQIIESIEIQKREA